MHIHAHSIKTRQIAKQLRVRLDHDRVIVNSDRTRQRVFLVGCTVFISILAAFVQSQSRNSSSYAYLAVAVMLGVPFAVIWLAFLSWGWHLVLDVQKSECVIRWTYARMPYRSKRVILSDGPIGPCTISITDKQGADPAVETIGCLFLALLGPFGLILGLLMRSDRSNRPREIVGKDYPAIFHYNELADVSTVIFAFEQTTDRDKVLKTFAELMPESVSTI